MTWGSVQDSAELRRILALPRRRWTGQALSDLVRTMSDALRVPGSSGTLRPLQAVALAELASWGGAFAPLPVGAGKTLLMALAPRVLPQIQRPLFLMPAALVKKTHLEFAEYRHAWVLPAFYRVESYETIWRTRDREGEETSMLERLRPDLIVCDEAHGLKNQSAAVTRAVARYLERERPIFFPMTGTPYSTTIRDFAHLLRFALPRTCPVPTRWVDLDEWARALDTDLAEHRQLDPGALALFCEPGEDHRAAFRRRLGDTPGVVLSTEPQLPIPLDVSAVVNPIDAPISTAIAELRASWDTPDGEPVEDGPSMWRHARELALGFFQVWDPRAPRDWREARRAWFMDCRDLLSNNRRNLDSADQLVRYLDANPAEYAHAQRSLCAWREIEPTFVPRSVPIWVSDHVTDWIADRATAAVERSGPLLIWTERPAVGHKLAAKLGARYYGEEGVCSATGQPVEAHRADRHGPIAVLATAPNSAGRNLQAWSSGISVDVTKSARRLEQMLGRTHRPGQAAPRVSTEFLIGVREDVDAMHVARARAERAAELTGQPQKILHANGGALEVPGLPALAPNSSEPRWMKSKPPAGRGKNMLALLSETR